MDTVQTISRKLGTERHQAPKHCETPILPAEANIAHEDYNAFIMLLTTPFMSAHSFT